MRANAVGETSARSSSQPSVDFMPALVNCLRAASGWDEPSKADERTLGKLGFSRDWYNVGYIYRQIDGATSRELTIKANGKAELVEKSPTATTLTRFAWGAAQHRPAMIHAGAEPAPLPLDETLQAHVLHAVGVAKRCDSPGAFDSDWKPALEALLRKLGFKREESASCLSYVREDPAVRQVITFPGNQTMHICQHVGTTRDLRAFDFSGKPLGHAVWSTVRSAWSSGSELPTDAIWESVVPNFLKDVQAPRLAVQASGNLALLGAKLACTGYASPSA
jgi:hypothetical protein